MEMLMKNTRNKNKHTETYHNNKIELKNWQNEYVWIQRQQVSTVLINLIYKPVFKMHKLH